MATMLLLAVSLPGTAAAHAAADDYVWADGRDGPVATGRVEPIAPGTPTEFWTSDLQAVLTILDVADDGPVTVALEPTLLSALGPLPDGSAEAGNAYRVGVNLDQVDQMLLRLRSAHPVTAVFVSEDGNTWRDAEAVIIGPDNASVVVGTAGWYLAVTDDTHQGSRWPRVAGAIGLGLAVAGLDRRRTRKRPAQATSAAAATRRHQR